MIVEFLLSLLTVSAVSIFYAYLSGILPAVMCNLPFLLMMLLVFATCVFLSGYGKDFCLIFSSRNKFKNTSLAKLKRTEYAIDFSQRVLLYIDLIYPVIQTIFVFESYNILKKPMTEIFQYWILMFLPFLYLCSFEIILFTLKGKVKKTIVLYMSESTDLEKQEVAVTSKKIIYKILKVIFSLALILFILSVSIPTIKIEYKEPNLFMKGFYNIPSILFIIVITLPLLALSGNFKIFFQSIKAAFCRKSVSITEKNLFVNAIKTTRLIILLSGVSGFLIELFAILNKRANIDSLLANIAVCLIVLFYAIVLDLILLPLENKICKLSDFAE